MERYHARTWKHQCRGVGMRARKSLVLRVRNVQDWGAGPSFAEPKRLLLESILSRTHVSLAIQPICTCQLQIWPRLREKTLALAHENHHGPLTMGRWALL